MVRSKRISASFLFNTSFYILNFKILLLLGWSKIFIFIWYSKMTILKLFFPKLFFWHFPSWSISFFKIGIYYCTHYTICTFFKILKHKQFFLIAFLESRNSSLYNSFSLYILTIQITNIFSSHQERSYIICRSIKAFL